MCGRQAVVHARRFERSRSPGCAEGAHPAPLAQHGDVRASETLTSSTALDAALAACSQELADEAEVIATAGRIIDGDPDSWIDEWMGTAGAVWADAADAEQDGRLSEACTAYRHASTYYAAALDRVFHCSEPERQPAIWRRQRDCWERALALEPTPVEHLRIPFGTGTLPGFFFPAPGTDNGAARPLLIVNNDLDRPSSQMRAYGDDLATACRCHWMTFDGPGQQAMLYERRCCAVPTGRRCSARSSTLF